MFSLSNFYTTNSSNYTTSYHLDSNIATGDPLSEYYLQMFSPDQDLQEYNDENNYDSEYLEFSLDPKEEAKLTAHHEQSSCANLGPNRPRLMSQESKAYSDMNKPISSGSTKADDQMSDQACDHSELRPNYGERYSSTSVKSSKTRPLGESSNVLSNYQVEQLKKKEFLSTLCRLIDRTPLRVSEVESLEGSDLVILSNFSYLMHGFSLNSSNSIEAQISQLNETMSNSQTKKKRNEERIKYTFKRANKIILKRFMQTHNLPAEQETEAKYTLIRKYFFGEEPAGAKGRSAGTSRTAATAREEEKLFQMLFKPSNLYRNDLKGIFRSSLYLQEFEYVLENLFYGEYLTKRKAKVESYISMLKEDIYYSPNKSDCTILSKRLKRMPWSSQEVLKGVQLMQELLAEHSLACAPLSSS